MKSTKKLLLFLMLCQIILLCIPIVSYSAETDMPSTEDAKAVYFYHIDSDSIVFSQNTTAVLPAGSTPKIMAGLLACEILYDRLDEEVSITSEMVAQSAGYRLYIKADDVLSVRDLLYAALCGSYNDAYDVLAHLIAGSKDSFVELMNTRADTIGANDTHYTDPSGILDSSVTSAEDLFKISKIAYANSLYMSIVSTERFRFEGSIKLDAQTIYNRNALIASNRTTLYYNALCKGISAGYTELAGNCVVTVADNGKERYLSIVLGAPETDERNYGYSITNSLIDWVYDTYTYMEVITPETVVCHLPVTVSDFTTEIEIRTSESLLCYLPKNAKVGEEITYSVRLIKNELEAPIAEGEMVGYVSVLYHGKRIGTLPLYTAQSAERSSFIGSILNLKQLTKNRVFVSAAIFFTVAFVGWIVTEYILYKRRHHKWDKYFSSTMTPSADALKKPEQKTGGANQNTKR